MKIFTRGKNFHLNACVGDNGGPHTFFHYALGYYEAAKQVAENIMIDDYHVDTKVYPLLFLYRQYVELIIKHLLITSSKLANKDIINIKGHEIDKKWRLLIHELDENSNLKAHIENQSFIEELIMEISSIDNNGETFRYPLDLQGREHLKNVNIINIENVHSAMTLIYKYFEKIDLEIDMINDYKYDISLYY